MTDNIDWIFITGGSGYIGSHIAAVLKSTTPYNVMLIDRRGQELPHTTRFCDIFADEDFTSPVVLDAVRTYKPKTVIHCAASSTISDGVVNPIALWDNNVGKTITFLNACAAAGIKKFIFASTSAVYDDSTDAVKEYDKINCLNSYASSKLAIEHLLRDCWPAYNLSSVSLRLFNVAGSHNMFDLGELNGSTHLIARIMESIMHNIPFDVYGKDWNTQDGTAIRDYVHVLDVAKAFISSIDFLDSNCGNYIFNIGSGNGHSVQEIINTAEMLLNKELSYRYMARRPGDSEKRFADLGLSNSVLKWMPKLSISDIIKDSFKWYSSDVYQNLTASGIKVI